MSSGANQILMKQYQLTPDQLKQYVAVLNAVERYRDVSDDEKERIVRAVMERPYMDLRSDWAFKHVFGDMNLLKLLLEDVLPEEISSVEPLDDLEALPNEIERFRQDDKNIIMDVLVKTADGHEIIVEMQRQNKNSFKNRMLYYGASMLHGQLKQTDPYSKLRPVYVLCFMDFKMAHQTDQLLYHYTLCEVNSGERYGNLISILLFELKRLDKKGMKGLSPLESWLYILKNMGKFAGKPEEMGSRYSAVAEAARMNPLPDEDKLKYLQNMITEEELLDIREATLEEGRMEGREEGRMEAFRQVAKNLLERGMALEEISKDTGLPLEEIKMLSQR